MSLYLDVWIIKEEEIRMRLEWAWDKEQWAVDHKCGNEKQT